MTLKKGFYRLQSGHIFNERDKRASTSPLRTNSKEHRINPAHKCLNVSNKLLRTMNVIKTSIIF